MAVSNGLPYLPAAVDSILAQTFTDFEFLIIDDHSTDGTRAYLDDLKDPRVRVFSSPGKGLTNALNFGLQKAMGKWIARMDADDWSFPHRLERQIEAAKQPGTVLVSANYVICDEGLKPVGEIHLCAPNPKLFSYLNKKNNPYCHPVMMFRRDEVLKLEGYRYERAQDYDLWIRLLEKGKVVQVNETLLKYRVRRDAISIQHREEQSHAKRAIQNNTNYSGQFSAKPNAHGQYFYRLGFAAWLAGNRSKAVIFLSASLLQWNNVLRCLMALFLLWLPKRLYLSIAGYNGIYQA
jgi:glycosyltransferase involved in cell wall biosynthesis